MVESNERGAGFMDSSLPRLSTADRCADFMARVTPIYINLVFSSLDLASFSWRSNSYNVSRDSPVPAKAARNNFGTLA